MFLDQQMKTWFTNSNSQHTEQTLKIKKLHLNSERRQ